ncbi:MAG: hypothetical protein KF797_10485 [Flavobacteriales bacterium]|nr:hypothetical protein [Flavobacteriales bacterium]
MRPRVMIAVAATIALAGGGTYAYLEYNRGVAGADSMPVKETVTAHQLLADFQADEAAATARYVGAKEQVVQVSGTIRSMEPDGTDKTTVVLEAGDELAGVVCEFANKDLPADLRSGATISVKGICTGLLMDVVLVRCIAVR